MRLSCGNTLKSPRGARTFGCGPHQAFRMSIVQVKIVTKRLSSLRCVGNGFDSPEDFARLFRGMVTDMHKSSAIAPIRFPDPRGAFPGDVLLCPPPVVLDANVLRNDIRRLPHRAENRSCHGRERRPSPPVLRGARLP